MRSPDEAMSSEMRRKLSCCLEKSKLPVMQYVLRQPE